MAGELTTVSFSALGLACTVTGAILEKWYELGGAGGILGCPVADEVPIRGDGGAMRFQRGSIYRHPDHGVYYVTGKIYRHWADALGVYGPYGYPAGDPVDEGACTRQRFAGGTVRTDMPVLSAGSDLRGEITRRGIAVRRQGRRPTCSVQTMVFLMEYQLCGLLGDAWGHLSVEYANHAANAACDLRSDGHYFKDIAAGYDAMGIVREALWPYCEQWTYDYEQGCRMADEEMICIGRRVLSDGLRLKGRFIKQWGDAGLTDEEFAECLKMLDEGVPVAIGRDHSMALVGYRLDAEQPGGGMVYFRNSYGTDGEFTGYQTETFEHVKKTVFDAYVYMV